MGARMEEPTGHDNYLGELAAQLDVLDHLPAGGRVLVVFDATSPVWAMRKFARCCERAKRRYYAGSWLEHLYRLVQRQELVVFSWQTRRTAGDGPGDCCRRERGDERAG